jgi:O-methyltransferase
VGVNGGTLRSKFVTAAFSCFRLLQALLWRAGIYLAVSRRSPRNQPEILNRASWRPFVFDDSWRSLYNSAQSVTRGDETDNINRQLRFYSTFQLVAYAATHLKGDVIECGCWHGHSSVAIATLLAERNFDGRFHVFDSFEGGLSAFDPNDESPVFALSEKEKQLEVQKFKSSYDFVNSVTRRFGFVELHRGWIPESFSGFQPKPIMFVHIDVDMYEPTKAALEFFWDSVVPGGCVVIDDYNSGMFEGATRAVDEFLLDKTPHLFYKVPLGSAFIVK